MMKLSSGLDFPSPVCREMPTLTIAPTALFSFLGLWSQPREFKGSERYQGIGRFEGDHSQIFGTDLDKIRIF
ncbi:hypothetical protein [Aliiroseovarius crassostreae]|uniref:hypothetical protein n=1 Tax=Aliiroseovarius crassostreae TaxID=154981 RepID=UPI002201F408|nr:hypothetical protein [Aliiroseovarius crassostreae]UWP87858.1 hypothetical protein K3J57_07840 [Aliiroseovarius crassostreae]UWQ00478.1 hypothetical protein K3X44_07910 [Aliiroseovarius crassostreae]